MLWRVFYSIFCASHSFFTSSSFTSDLKHCTSFNNEMDSHRYTFCICEWEKKKTFNTLTIFIRCSLLVVFSFSQKPNANKNRGKLKEEKNNLKLALIVSFHYSLNIACETNTYTIFIFFYCISLKNTANDINILFGFSCLFAQEHNHIIFPHNDKEPKKPKQNN